MSDQPPTSYDELATILGSLGFLVREARRMRRLSQRAAADQFRDEGDAQEMAVHIQRSGRQVQIFMRTVEVTKLIGVWAQIPAMTPADADAEMQSEVSR